ncbi:MULTISPECIES: CynX/NimT family MFS transporter [unclassified Paenibacillus]|uniref:MFS transporter n=1 Tax=unclassified Paenibacillus TaxID=185978 RepID=UPI000CFBA05D|nr:MULTISPECIES: MFS transporter [unclassified Paenibacillus]PRA07695.1 MFS transporter [Paenibacillus sp. MYb63]PRA51340.1 MFS transporter [Paenibacillus sp. MYb67]
MRRKMFLIIALFVATLNLRPAINSISPLLDTIREDLGMSAALASLLTSIPVLCMGVFSPFAVKASGRWGIERIIGYSLIVVGIGIATRLFTQSTSVLLLSALIVGIGIASIGPLTSGFIKKYFPDHVPSMIALYSIAITLGAAVSSMVSIPLKTYFNSWQIAVGGWAVIAFVAAIIWWIMVKPRSESANANVSEIKERPIIKLPWGNRSAWTLTLSFGLMAMLFYSFTAWLPLMIQEMGYSKSYATLCLTIFVVIQIPISFVLPVLLKNFPSRRVWMVGESLFMIVGLILLMMNFIPMVSVVLFGVGAGGLFTLNLMLPIDSTTNVNDATSWSAMQQSAGYVIGALGPILLGWIHDASNSFTPAMIGMIVIIILMIMTQIAATRRKKVMESV